MKSKVSTKKYKKLFQINYQLRDLVMTMIEAKPKVITPRDCVACFTLSKIYKTHGVAVNLAKHGYAEDADMLIRTLFDALLIQRAVLKDSTEDTAIKYLRFDDITRTKMYSAVSKTETYKDWFQERADNPKPGDETVEEIQNRATTWKEEYKNQYWQRWHSDQTTGQLAESVEQGHYFATAYGLQSQLTHSSPRTMNLYLVDDGSNLVMDVSPKDRGIDLSLVSAFNMLILAAERFDDHFKLGNAGKINALLDEYPKVVHELKD